MITTEKLLRGISRAIPVRGDNISFLKTPTHFRDTLLNLSSTVQHRARISSLYIGNGSTEREMVGNLARAVQYGGSDVSVVIDRYRGTREGGGALKDLRNLCPVYLYQTPTLPRTRYNKPGFLGEVLGVHHMKYFLFDDQVILSGANLSEVYFGARTDRYMLVRSRALADYICYVHSLHTLPANTWDMRQYTKSLWSKEGRRAAARTADMMTHVAHHEEPPPEGAHQEGAPDTVLYPLFQIPWFSVQQVAEVVELVLGTADSGDLVTISSGYFNPSVRLCEAIAHSKARVNIIIPSAACNGFHGGRGVKGLVPGQYTLSAARTLSRCSNVAVHQYDREGWSYHAKGVWADGVAILGSSNFNRRSELRDSEFCVAMVTDNENLKSVISTELEELYKYTTVFQTNYKPFNRLLHPVMSRFL